MTKLFLGDCLERLKEIADHSVDMVLADLPYGTTACKWDNVIPFEPLWEQLHRVCKPNAAMCMFGSEPFSSKMRMSNLKRFRYDWVWRKTLGTGNMNANKMPIKKHELISVFYLKLPTYNPQFKEGKPYKDKRGDFGKRSNNETYGDCVLRFAPINNLGTRYPDTVIDFSNPNNDRLHPTQKPVALLEYLIKTYTNEGDTVLDPTMGSGSTGVACKNLGRNFIGIEKELTYYDIATKRIYED